MTKNNIATFVAVVAAFAASVEPAAAQRMLGDRSAEAVEAERKGVNDASILDIKDRYADIAVAFDGNVTTAGGGAIKVVAQDKADQGVNIGIVLGGEYYADHFSPEAGIAATYTFRKIRLEADGTVGIGYPDKLSDDQSKFPEFTGTFGIAYQLHRSPNLKNSFWGGVYGGFKASKNSIVVNNDNGGYFWDKTNAFNVGCGASFAYIYSPSWSAISHVFQLKVGVQHKLHTEKSGTIDNFEFGGKKAYPEVSLTYGLMLGLGKRHSKAYNDALKKHYSESQMRSMVGLK